MDDSPDQNNKVQSTLYNGLRNEKKYNPHTGFHVTENSFRQLYEPCRNIRQREKS